MEDKPTLKQKRRLQTRKRKKEDRDENMMLV